MYRRRREGDASGFMHSLVGEGMLVVRGCEVEGMLDVEGKLIEEGPAWITGAAERTKYKNLNRTFRVWLDPTQYYEDMSRLSKGTSRPSSIFDRYGLDDSDKLKIAQPV